MSGTGHGKGHGKGKVWVDPLVRTIVAATVPSTGVDVIVEPDAAERKVMAHALDLNDIGSLRAEYRLARRSGGLILVKGRLIGSVRPTCIVTLEPFDLRIDELVEVRFSEEREAPREGARDVRREDARHAEMAASDADDPPDVIENGVIDLGRVTTEFLSLAIPPFPRKPGVDFSQAAEEGAQSPFAALAGLAEKKE